MVRILREEIFMVSLVTCSIDMNFAPKDVGHAVQLLLSVSGSIQAKRGCRTCKVWIDAADAGWIHYSEEWESREDFYQNIQSEEFRRVLIAVDMGCEEPKIVVGNLSGQSGMACLLQLRETAIEPLGGIAKIL
jgi:quinol monooxygenase YgiN